MLQNSKKNNSKNSPSSKKKGTRLNKFLSNAGICSRREADELISMGLVSVNGISITQMGFYVQKDDEVRYDGQKVRSSPNEYILLNKPKGFVSNKQGGNIKKSVQELVRNTKTEDLIPVGDMGRTVSGLLFLTNDYKLRKTLFESKNKLKMIYEIFLERNISGSDFKKLTKGLDIQNTEYKIKKINYVIGGTKRQIGVEVGFISPAILFRMFKKINHKVLKMDRIMYAGLTKKNLPRGKWRKLVKKEIQFLHIIPK
tara:strand:- start:10060 stop:10827 length:768 start_codon:yes stop_codon:yes gene_type:complete